MASKWVNLSNSERDFLSKMLKGNDEAKSILKKLSDADKKIKVSSAKGKGRGLQHWTCERISKMIDIPFDNQSDDSLIRSREMGQKGVDVVLRGEAKKRFPFTVECKSVETIHFRDFVDQARKYSDEGGWLLVIRTKSLLETTVTMSWGLFENLFEGKFILRSNK